MQPEAREIAEARGLLSKFEAQISRPEGIAHLMLKKMSPAERQVLLQKLQALD